IAIAAPRIAAHHASANYGEIAHIGRRTALLASAATLPVLIVLVTIPGPLLGLFGSGFDGGDTALRILALGQFANVSVGAVGYLLVMTGRESRALKALTIGAATNLVLAFALIPPLDASGAALAAALALLVNNAVGLWFVRRELGFWSLPMRLKA
ncbi:MAG: hypothetical protein HKN80_13745, partial [Acidimicrobiia bacterium]|nr:hypothetical protein [Acidimicrobiia bacterium]